MTFWAVSQARKKISRAVVLRIGFFLGAFHSEFYPWRPRKPPYPADGGQSPLPDIMSFFSFFKTLRVLIKRSQLVVFTSPLTVYF